MGKRMKFNWRYNERTDSWMFGDPTPEKRDGAEVRYVDDKNDMDYGKWTGTVVMGEQVSPFFGFNTCQEAQEHAEKEYTDMLYGNENFV